MDMRRAAAQFITKTKPACRDESVVKGEKYRFTVLTSRMIRMEYCEDGVFEDRATQTVLNRDFPEAGYRVMENADGLEIITDHLHLIYNKKKFSANGLSVQIRGKFSKFRNTWHYGEETDDLGGTVRTLDQVDGGIPLEHGLLSKNGFTVLDDSRSLILTGDGWVEPRGSGVLDFYFFGYGRSYLECLKDFYRLCGPQQLLPRYALGNWWSRYYKYSDVEYKELMQRFEKEEIPFSVAVLDMDWHVVDVDPKYGSGWTGYTWNRSLFPEPREFMEWLHKKGLRVTLNIHPADGIKPYEDVYDEAARALGFTEAGDNGIPFDVTDPEFMEAYFKYLLHPHEDMGVDFWWIDWQSGDISKITGLDPLWMLNHYQYLDSGRNGERPLILSRYAGVGSHRYPLGFSGDTIVSWDSLAFQPCFTANASNVGYGWWSHDIGGHMNGIKDDELATRWVQLGVFSPVNRLHSSDNPFDGKEPWRYRPAAQSIMGDFLRLRHKLIPYLYTMNRLCVKDSLPLVRPMYYHHPWEEEAYQVPNEYYFGTRLIACPITGRMNQMLDVAEVKVWLPEGLWIDFFSGMVYKGGRRMSLYRSLECIPVLAEAGAIVPMADLNGCGASAENPEKLEIRIFGGADGEFHLYEDEGRAQAEEDGDWADTEFRLDWGGGIFDIAPVAGNAAAVSQERSYTLKFMGVPDCGITAESGGEMLPFEREYDPMSHTLTVKCLKVSSKDGARINLGKNIRLEGNRVRDKIFDFLNYAQIRFALKKEIYDIVASGNNTGEILSGLCSMHLEKDLYGALCEMLTAWDGE